MSPTKSERSFTAVEQELDNERAAVLGRTGRRLEEALAVCAVIARRLDELDGVRDAAEQAAVLAEYREARQVSEEWRWRLGLQREVVGLTDHRWVDIVHPPPPDC